MPWVLHPPSARRMDPKTNDGFITRTSAGSSVSADRQLTITVSGTKMPQVVVGPWATAQRGDPTRRTGRTAIRAFWPCLDCAPGRIGQAQSAINSTAATTSRSAAMPPVAPACCSGDIDRGTLPMPSRQLGIPAYIIVPFSEGDLRDARPAAAIGRGVHFSRAGRISTCVLDPWYEWTICTHAGLGHAGKERAKAERAASGVGSGNDCGA